MLLALFIYFMYNNIMNECKLYSETFTPKNNTDVQYKKSFQDSTHTILPHDLAPFEL